MAAYDTSNEALGNIDRRVVVSSGAGDPVALLDHLLVEMRVAQAGPVLALDHDRVRAAGALGRQIALNRHRRPQLPVDKLMQLVAEAGDIELVISLPQINAADIAIRPSILTCSKPSAVPSSVKVAKVLSSPAKAPPPEPIETGDPKSNNSEDLVEDGPKITEP